MHLARRSRPLLVTVVLVALLVLAGCTLVSDQLTGVSLDKANPTSCVQSCAHSMADQVHAEADLHQAAIRACQGLSGSERATCIQAEAARHQAAMSQISSDRQACMNNCHRQGSGSAG